MQIKISRTQRMESACIYTCNCTFHLYKIPTSGDSEGVSHPIMEAERGGVGPPQFLPVTFYIAVRNMRCVFARDSIYAIARICYRPSVCLSVRPSVTRVDQSKTVEVRVMQLSPPGSPVTLVSSRLTSPRNSKGNIGSEGAK